MLGSAIMKLTVLAALTVLCLSACCAPTTVAHQQKTAFVATIISASSHSLIASLASGEQITLTGINESLEPAQRIYVQGIFDSRGLVSVLSFDLL